jgi:hypothetical protein
LKWQIIVLVITFVFVVGTIGLNAVAPAPSYDNIPISIASSSWRIDESSQDFALSKDGVFFTQYNYSLYLDLEITNNSNKTINNIRAFYGYEITSNDNSEYAYTYEQHNYSDLLSKNRRSAGAFYYESGNYSLKGGESIMISLYIEGFLRSEKHDNPFADKEISGFELYISWLKFSGFGGQWGDAFSIPSWPVPEDFDLSSVTVKFDIEPFNTSQVKSS